MTTQIIRAALRLAAPALLAATLFVAPALAHDKKTVGDITVSNVWTRATPPNARAGGGFAVIENKGAEEDRLVSVASDIAESTELHEMTVSDGVMKMREMADGITVPASGTLELKPGGFHVMFMGLKAPLKQGELVPVTLTFEKAGSVTLDFKVERLGARGPEHGENGHAGPEAGEMKKMDGMDHGNMDHSGMDHGSSSN